MVGGRGGEGPVGEGVLGLYGGWAKMGKEGESDGGTVLMVRRKMSKMGLG